MLSGKHGGDMFTDTIEKNLIAFLRDQEAWHSKEIASIERGDSHSHSAKDGKMVDTTADTLAEHKRQLAVAQDILKRMFPPMQTTVTS